MTLSAMLTLLNTRLLHVCPHTSLTGVQACRRPFQTSSRETLHGNWCDKLPANVVEGREAVFVYILHRGGYTSKLASSGARNLPTGLCSQEMWRRKTTTLDNLFLLLGKLERNFKLPCLIWVAFHTNCRQKSLLINACYSDD